MKVVFPSVGSLVLLKQDLETLQAFYKTSLMTSKLFETSKTSNAMIQIGNFNYLPQNNSVVLDNAKFLTIDDMRSILGIYSEEKKSENTSTQTATQNESNYEEPISDNDLLSNPFFQTLHPLN